MKMFNNDNNNKDLSVVDGDYILFTFDLLSFKGCEYFFKNFELVKRNSEIVPLNPSREMLLAALGESYSEEQAFELKKMWRNMIHEHQKTTINSIY